MSRAIPVLMYHHVSPNPGLVTVSPKVFRRQMAHLAKAGYQALTADAFLDCIQGVQPIPRKAVLITFDDGYLDNYVYAYPVLRRYGLRATIFVVTGWIRDGPARAHADSDASRPETPDHRACRRAIVQGQADDVMLRWSEVEAMQDTVEVHSHTHTHTRWDELYPTTSRRLELLQQDLVKSRTVLQERIGRPSRHLCWPWGYVGDGYPRIAMAAGFRAQYLTQKGINTVGTNPAEIGRAVIKDRADSWFSTRIWIYRQRTLGRLYVRMRGRE